MLVAASSTWLKMLGRLNRDALRRAPVVAREVSHKIEYEPASVSDSDVTGLKSYGCSEGEIFNLILSAAAGAGLLRLEAGLRAMDSQFPTTQMSGSYQILQAGA
jgi:hypothetical protein